MKRFHVIFLLSILLIPVCQVYGRNQVGLMDILDGILSRYKDIKGLSIPYEREIITKSSALLGDEVKGDIATGIILFRSPDYLSIIQKTPKSETITTDGTTLWWYIPDKKVVHEYPSDRLGNEIRLFSDIFRGLSNIEDSFDVIQTELGDPEQYNLQLIPNPQRDEIKHIILKVSKDTFDIKVMEIHNLFGNITRFMLGDFTERDDLDEGDFRFEVSEGVKVLKD